MVRAKMRARVFGKWFPRTRGDGPPLTLKPRLKLPVPPHPRGWSQCLGGWEMTYYGSPAPAGMVPPKAAPLETSSRFPRTRGDGPVLQVQLQLFNLVPPHPRGWSLEGIRDGARVAGSPAPAGMVPVARWRRSSRTWFPRTRGDGPVHLRRQVGRDLVPPHPRGWSLQAAGSLHGARGSPAPAGMVPIRGDDPRSPCGFPRTRGDGPVGKPSIWSAS
ncbi:hypothetical protein SP5_076_00950 [Sphingomonas parapaucimobilis NBRC 15100]|uniref:Uncharacterized protein n=1 Tax=Sphingomonas parapaucimobilis NBRC 15100 TaxID=1219049 RepID=A0A0A1WAD6_9SPHN|nr:hypothetical protein SP5_076_00950 [Sphingomonas parapaucimobilis NBRC 15100]